MSSFFGKLKSGTGTTGTTVGSPKKDPNAPPLTPLERMLKDAGPLRQDGSDKFFGMENVYGNTCYCNSILQCLFYTPPFREHVLNYPSRSPADTVTTAISNAAPRTPASPQLNGTPKKPVVTPQPRNAQGTPQQKPDDKDSPEYKKKQALAAGPIINLTYQNHGAYDMPESLFSSLKDIFEAVVIDERRYGIVSPHKFLEVLRKENEMFRSAMHQDAHEFLNLLLNAVVESVEAHERKLKEAKEQETNGVVAKKETGSVWFPKLPTPDEDSPSRWLHNLFEGKLTSETRCLTCENVSHRDEPFLDLSVDLEQHSSVTACLRRFSAEEMLCERNKFHCDNCGGLQEAEKRMKIKRLPKILALHLKRFKYTEDLQRLQKLFHTVVYPDHLRLFNTTDDAEDPDRIYELYAVVVHIGGGPYHGHYVAIIKTQDRGWLLFDDEMVEPVDKNYVRNFFGDRPGLACAYVLFYQETTIEAVRREQKMEGKARASTEQVAGLGVSVRESDELQRIQSSTPPTSPLDAHSYASLTHAVTAPPTNPEAHFDQPTSPRMPPGPSHFKSFIGSRKEKGAEEKDKKAAEKVQEKEKQAADKQKRRDAELKLAEAQKKQQAELQAAIDADRQARMEEAKRTAEKEGPLPNGSPGSPSGLDRFRRTKSLRFASLGKKDKPSYEPEEPINENPDKDKDKDKDKEKDLRKRFSMRKKSYGM